MQYIRFLKTPRVTIGSDKRTGSISALVTVTSDLGESFFFRDTILSACLVNSDLDTANATQLARKQFQWKAGMRVLKLSLEFAFSKQMASAPAVLEVFAEKGSADNLIQLTANSEIISAYSSSFLLNNGAQAGGYVERRFTISRDLRLCIWEETGESIARHIWDGGLALTAHVARNISSADTGTLGILHKKLHLGRNMNVLEVGSGCGIVGLAMATLSEHINVTLTDLPLATEILVKNLQFANLLGKANIKVLDWDEELPAVVLNEPLDIILAADCMYNASSAPSLVRVLTKLARAPSKPIIVLAHKKRHDSEKVFFELMKEFEIVEQARVVFGGEHQSRAIDIYTMRWSALSR